MSVLADDEIGRMFGEYENAHGPGATVLEAGSGKFKHFAYPETMPITGLDISAEQLAANAYAVEHIQADVQTYQTGRQWDIVVSIFVLEHLEDPDQALRNMLAWTRPGGLLVLAVPNALSLKGLVTKLTPFRFHEWFYRHIYRRPHSIFPTTLKFCIAPRALRRRFAAHDIVYERLSGESFGFPFNIFYAGMILLLKIVSLWQWRPENSNYLLVVRKNAADTGEPVQN